MNAPHAAIELALLGCGRVVEEQHAPVYRDPLNRLTPVALADPVASRRQVVGDQLDIPVARRFHSPAELFASGLPDAVVVATPTATHHELVAGALTTGVGVVCEKPLAPSTQQCGELIDLARRAGVGLAVIHNYASASTWLKVRELLASGAAGEPRRFEVRLEDQGPLLGAPDAEPAWRLDLARAGGGCLLDQGYHFVYLAELLVGRPICRVHAREVGAWARRQELERVARVTLTHEGNLQTELSLSWTAARRSPPELIVHCTQGEVVIDEDRAAVGIRAGGDERWVDCSSDPDGYRGALPSALRRVRGGGGAATDQAAAAQRVVAIISACYLAASECREVAIGASP
ncbi:MAG: hypothetical protein QOJ97_191 [Solirubrobacteraceae bacterium]|nr:hypothetical protein [Solirubrobacteraceae bacterium]